MEKPAILEKVISLLRVLDTWAFPAVAAEMRAGVFPFLDIAAASFKVG